MTLPKYIHSYEEQLPKTLASRVSFIRNARRIHIQELSLRARVSVKLVEDIESGIETWLSTSVRQRIARVLKVDPIILQEVEVKDEREEILKTPPLELQERIKDKILSSKKNIQCPLCGNNLMVRIQEGFDLNGEPVKSAKAHCSVCVFQLK